MIQIFELEMIVASFCCEMISEATEGCDNRHRNDSLSLFSEKKTHFFQAAQTKFYSSP